MGRFTQSLARRFKGSSRPDSPAQAALPATPPPTATLEPSAEPPAEPSAPRSFAPEISAANLQGRLWNQAYDGAKADEPKIVEAYERLLSELQNDPNSALAPNGHAERERQMEQLVEIGLQRTEKAAALTEKVGDGLQTVMTVKGLVSSAVQAAPAAAVAWVGVCFALEVLSNSFTEANATREGLAYVVSRMDWYWNLVDLLLDSGAKTELAGLRGRLEVHIIRLYQQLLLYQMRSIYLFHQNQGVVFFKNSIKLDDWKGRLDEIKVAEAAMLEDSKQFNSQRVHKHLQDLAIIAEGQRDKLELMTSAIQDQTSRQEQMYQDEKDSQCLHALCETDPRLDKARIQDNKGGLLRDSYAWVLENPEFEAWRTNPDHRLLWIRGDPGKGKTMLLCGILDELEQHSTSRQAYFFCQETNRNLNNATAVLRGLIFSLVCQQPKLISHVRKEYDPVGQKLFEGSNVWEAMSKILTAILSDTSLNSTFLVVDALDECGEGRAKLLKLIVALSASPRIKWVVSSRNWADIQEQLNIADQKVTLHLELNEKSISVAVNAYIRDKVGELARLKEYDEETRATVEQTFVDKADNTFLWVALAFQELAAPDVQSWEASDILQTLPTGLQPLYQRMMGHIEQSRHKKLCRDILAAVSVVYRPISLQELPSLVESLARFAKNPLALEKLTSCCGSFLTLQGSVISFVHQSAKDFLLSEETIDQILPCGIQHQHRTIFSESVKALSKTLRHDIYQLGKPGASINMSLPSPDPLTPVRYACAYWVDHLQDANVTADLTQRHLHDDGTVHDFLRRKFLYWLEAACFSRDISGAILALQKLETLLTQTTSSQQLSALVRDALRFVYWCRRGIETTPLQLYASALLFCPRRSLVRNFFERDAFTLIQLLSPHIPADWDSCAQTLEGHHSPVNSVVFAPDGRLVSASSDRTIKVWDLATGACIATLGGHRDAVMSVAFAPDGRLASASSDRAIKVWDLATGACIATLEGHRDAVMSVAFAPDGRLVSGSEDMSIKVWDAATNACEATLEGHTGCVNSVAFALDGRLASGSDDMTVKVWDLDTKVCTATLDGRRGWVQSLAFAPDGRLALACSDDTVEIWDPATSVCIATLDGHRGWVLSVAFAPDGGRLASASADKTVKVWDLATNVCVITLEGHKRRAESVVFTPDGRRLVSASEDDMIKVWDPITDTSVATFEGHSGRVTLLEFSPDRRWLASGSEDKTVKVWDPITRTSVSTFEGHSDRITSIAFSPDGRRLASASFDKTVKVWDLATGVCIATLEGHRNVVWSIAFAPDGRRLASASYDRTVKVWDPDAGACVQTLHVEKLPDTLEFSSTTKFELTSNDHILRLEPWATDHELQQVSHAPQSSHTLSVSSDEAWIRKDGEDVLWVPPEYRSEVVAVAGPLLAMGHISGRVMFYSSF